MIDQKLSPRAIPTIVANIMSKATAGIRIMTLYRRPRAMPANALIIANSSDIALTTSHRWSRNALATSSQQARRPAWGHPRAHHADARRWVNQPEVSPGAIAE